MKVSSSLSLTVADYSTAASITTYEQDGWQRLQISFLATARLKLLLRQASSIFPSLHLHKFTYLPFGVGLVSAFGFSLAKLTLSETLSKLSHRDLLTKLISENFLKLVSELDERSRWLFQHANVMINTLSCVTYVALIELGHPAVGIIGLLGQVLIWVKREGKLPGWIDTLLAPIAFVLELMVQYSMPATYFTRFLQLCSNLNTATDLVKQHEFLSRFLPDDFMYPLPGKHVKQDVPEQKNIETMTLSNEPFQVNWSSLYTKELNDVLPSDYKKTIDLMDAKELFAEVERRLRPIFAKKVEASFDIKMPEADRKKLQDEQATLAELITLCQDLSLQQELRLVVGGLDEMRTCVVDGQVKGRSPPNLGLFNRSVKALLDSTLKDPDGFEEKIWEFAQTGHSCTDGWLSEVDFLLLPQTKEAAWAVHHRLAQWRSNRLKDCALEIDREIQTIPGMHLDHFGGALGTHVNNALQCAAWPRFRPYEGELHHQVYPRHLLETLFVLMMSVLRSPTRVEREEGEKKGLVQHSILQTCQELIHQVQEGKMSFSEILFICHEVLHIHKSLFFAVPMIVTKLINLDKSYTEDRIVDEIYDAILHRDIPWEAIQGWIGQIDEKVKVLDNQNKYLKKWVKEVSVDKWVEEKSDEDGPRWTKTDDGTKWTLTKGGVRLLLWDLGVIEPKQED